MTECSFRLAQKLVQQKWMIVIIQNLRNGPVRFNELSRRIPQIQTSVFNRNLVQLQNTGLIERQDFHEAPFHVEYALTDLGREFLTVIDSMETFAKTYAAGKKELQMEHAEQLTQEQQIHDELTRKGRRLLRLIMDSKEQKAAAHWINNSGEAGISLFRIQNGEPILEAENVQTIPDHLSHSGHSMIDDPTGIADPEDTERNRESVKELAEAMISGNIPAMAGHFSDNVYINHNPESWDGLDGLQKSLKARIERGIIIHYDALKDILAQGNFVVSEITGTTDGKPTVFMDIFRLEHGIVREHWDVVQIQQDSRSSSAQ